MAKLIADLKKPENLVLILISFLPPLFALNFGLSHAENVPVFDQWCHSVPAVVSVMEGDFTPDYIWQQHNAHRIAPTILITLAFANLTDWNQSAEALFNLILLLVNWILLVILLKGSSPKISNVLLIIGVFVFSLLLYSLRLRSIWLWSYSSPYVIGYTLLLVTLLILQRTKPGWSPLWWIIVITFIANFAIGSSFLFWILFPIGFLIYGYRKASYYLAWVGAALLTVVLYFFIMDFKWVDNGNFCLSNLSLGSYISIAEYIKLYPQTLARILSSPFLSVSFEDMYVRYIAVGGIVFLVGLINLIALTFIAWRQSDFRVWFTWVSIAIVGLAGISVALYSRPDSLLLVRPTFSSTYAIQPTMIIVSIAAVGIFLTFYFENYSHFLAQAVRYVNILAFVLLIGLWLNINITNSNTIVNPIGELPGVEPSPAAASCMRNYFFSTENCHDYFFVGDIFNPDEEFYRYHIEKLAEYRLTAFAEIHFTVPISYDGTQPIIVYAPLAEQQLPIYSEDGSPIDESLIYRIVDEAEVEWMERYGAENLILINSETEVMSIYNQIPESVIWYIGLPDEKGDLLEAYIDEQREIVWTRPAEDLEDVEPHQLDAKQYGAGISTRNSLDISFSVEPIF